jgi:hypothetical protein
MSAGPTISCGKPDRPTGVRLDVLSDELEMAPDEFDISDGKIPGARTLTRMPKLLCQLLVRAYAHGASFPAMSLPRWMAAVSVSGQVPFCPYTHRQPGDQHLFGVAEDVPWTRSTSTFH